VIYQSQVLAQLNLPPSTLSLVEENGDLERAGEPWVLVPAGHTIGSPEPIFSEMVSFLLTLVTVLILIIFVFCLAGAYVTVTFKVVLLRFSLGSHRFVLTFDALDFALIIHYRRMPVHFLSSLKLCY
jgi:hypothetical protein